MIDVEALTDRVFGKGYHRDDVPGASRLFVRGVSMGFARAFGAKSYRTNVSGAWQPRTRPSGGLVCGSGNYSLNFGFEGLLPVQV